MSRNRTNTWACSALVALVSLLAYVNAVPNAFTNWDDRALALAEPASRSLDGASISRMFQAPVGKAYLPLRTLSYAVDHAIWGERASGYHLTNVLLHGANGVLVLALACRLCASMRAGLLCALLFALHPVQTESVAWVAGRRDVLSALFYLAATVWYLRAMRRSQRGLAAGVLLLLACLSKGTSVVFPAMALVLELVWTPAPERHHRRLARQALVWAVAVAMIGIHIGVGQSKDVIQPPHGGTALSNLTTMAKAFARYVAATAWPVHLSAKHHFPPTLAVAWLLAPVAFILWMVEMLARPGSRRAGLCLAWFAVGLVPVSGIVFPLSHPYAERYLYVPIIGLLALAARRLRSRGCAGLLAAAVAFSALTANRVFDWRTSESLWRSVVRVHPRSGDGTEGLLFTHLEDQKSHCALAVARLMRSTDADPFITRLLMAQMLLRAGHHVPARDQAVQAIATNSSDPRGYVVAGDIERALGETDTAEAFYVKALELDKTCAEAHFALGVLCERNRPRVALRHYGVAAESQPENAEVQYNLGNVLFTLGYNARAERAYRAAIAASPTHAKARCNLGGLYVTMRDVAKAFELFTQALAVEPYLPEAHLHLATIEEASGQRQAAIARLERLLQHRPGLRLVQRELNRMKSGNLER